MKITQLEIEIAELENNVKQLIQCLNYYSTQYNGHYAKEIINLVTQDGH